MNMDTDLTCLTEIKSKGITDQNVKPQTIKLEDNTGENLGDLRYDKDFLDITPKSQSMKEIIKLDFIKIKNFCSVKENVTSIRREALDWKKILA